MQRISKLLFTIFLLGALLCGCSQHPTPGFTDTGAVVPAPLIRYNGYIYTMSHGVLELPEDAEYWGKSTDASEQTIDGIRTVNVSNLIRANGRIDDSIYITSITPNSKFYISADENTIYCKKDSSFTPFICVDLSDIENMNIGAELPRFIYADDDKALLTGSFGIIEYDFIKEKVSCRISYDDMEYFDIELPQVIGSADGKNVYITDADGDKMYKCNIRNQNLEVAGTLDAELFSPKIVNTNDESNANDFDFNYLVSDTLIDKGETYLYIRANTDWSMRSLQLVECDSKSKAEIKVIDVFA